MILVVMPDILDFQFHVQQLHDESVLQLMRSIHVPGCVSELMPGDLFPSFMDNDNNRSEYCQLSKAIAELLCRDSQTKGLVFNLLNSKHKGRVLSIWAKLKREMVDRFSS